MRNRIPLAMVLTLLLALPAAAQAGSSGSPLEGNPQASGGLPADEAPEGFVRARKRQEMRDVIRHGIQATCGTDERPVTCTMTARRGRKVINRESAEIARPYNRHQFHLELEGRTGRRIVRHGPPVEVTLDVKVVDTDGNVSRDFRKIRLVRDT